MVRKITRFKSKNLLGETRREEQARLRKVITKAILSGKKSKEILNMSSIRGATKSQLSKRKIILKNAGLSGQKTLTIRQRKSMII